jgi:hypothetical protein
MPAFQRDVLISLVKNKAEAGKTPTVVGPPRAQKHLQSSASAAASPSSPMTDPWQSPHQDPWQSWKGSTGGADANHFKRYDALVDKLTTDVQASIQQQGGSHGDDVADARINKLETDMEEIKAHNATFHNWFKETGNGLARQDEQLSHLHTAFQQNQQDLKSVRTEVHSSADNLHQAMQVSFGSMKAELASELTTEVSSQMDRLESLLAKRQRREN